MIAHDKNVSLSFSPRAEAYLSSPVHAAGADLEWLATATAALRSPRVLDLGCGAGHASFAVAPFVGEVVAFDLSSSMLAVVASAAAGRQLNNIRTAEGSVEQLPFAAGSFDFVVSRYSAHHWRDVPQALLEVKRVLAPGGQVCFIDVAGAPTPLCDTHLQALELLRDPSHVRDYTRREWIALFAEAGFSARVAEEWRLDLDFTAWITRIGTAPDRVAALRALWAGAPAEAQTYFQVRDDLSFAVDALLLVASPVAAA